MSFKLLGCYSDRQKQNGRSLPELLFTDRDKKSKKYSGIPLSEKWGDWDNYIEGLVCRCSKAAKEKLYSHFGIQYHGECKFCCLMNFTVKPLLSGPLLSGHPLFSGQLVNFIVFQALKRSPSWIIIGYFDAMKSK